MRLSPYKSYATYLSKKYTPNTNIGIGRIFGISYSAVTKIGSRLKNRINVDNRLKKEINEIEGGMSYVKG